MRIYFAGIPAGDGDIEFRENLTMIMIDFRLVSYHFVLNKAHPMDVIEEEIYARNRNLHEH